MGTFSQRSGRCERGITHVKDQHGSPVLIETEQEQNDPQVSWPTCWDMIRTRGLSPSQKSTLFNLLNHLTGKPFKMENLAILHIELEDPSLQLPLTFFLAEVIKNLSAQRKAKKREDLMLLKANILAKCSFLEHIPKLALPPQPSTRG